MTASAAVRAVDDTVAVDVAAELVDDGPFDVRGGDLGAREREAERQRQDEFAPPDGSPQTPAAASAHGQTGAARAATPPEAPAPGVLAG